MLCFSLSSCMLLNEYTDWSHYRNRPETGIDNPYKYTFVKTKYDNLPIGPSNIHISRHFMKRKLNIFCSFSIYNQEKQPMEVNCDSLVKQLNIGRDTFKLTRYHITRGCSRSFVLYPNTKETIMLSKSVELGIQMQFESTYTYNIKAFKSFYENNNLKLIFRGAKNEDIVHEFAPDGFRKKRVFYEE